MTDLVMLATTPMGRQRAFEIALVAHVLLAPTLLDGRRRPRVSLEAHVLVAAIVRGQPTVFPEGLDLLGHEVTAAVGWLARAAADITVAELAALGSAALVCDVLGATVRRKTTAADRLLEEALAGGAAA